MRHFDLRCTFGKDPRDQRWRTNQNHGGTKGGECVDVGTSHPAVEDVADDQDPLPLEGTEMRPQGRCIEQTLRWMLVTTVSGVDRGDTGGSGHERCTPGERRADHQGLHAHRRDVGGGIRQRLAFADARTLPREDDRLMTKPMNSGLKAAAGSS